MEEGKSCSHSLLLEGMNSTEYTFIYNKLPPNHLQVLNNL